MGHSNPPAVFAGAIEDAWVASIAAAMPAGTLLAPCLGGLPEQWPAGSERAAALALHRGRLNASDALWVARRRGEGWFPKVVLIAGPHVRYHQVQRWSTLVDVILPEAIASEVIARHVGEAGADGMRPASGGRAQGRRPRSLTVVSNRNDVRSVLAAMGESAGYRVEPARDWSAARPGGLAVWDVPLLDPAWPEELALCARGRAVVAWLGFADRELVGRARGAGAAACLDSTCAPADLAFVLNRLALAGCGPRAEPAHDLPPSPWTAASNGEISTVRRRAVT